MQAGSGNQRAHWLYLCACRALDVASFLVRQVCHDKMLDDILLECLDQLLVF
jgi:hypothetical protein